MDCSLAVVVLGGMAIAQIGSAQPQVTSYHSELSNESASASLSPLPPMPRGKSTILGGTVRSVDPVRDELTLKVFGQRPLRILFDERTEVYRDGTKIPLRELSSTGHASVQTVLDGTNVYALSIHLLSQSPEGEYQGQVLNYNLNTRELTVSVTMSHDTLNLLVPVNTPVARLGESAFVLA
jgi:hypothetical protein